MILDFFNSPYNARHLEPKEVAERFIWSENFEKLIQNNHSVILGARGCGKTTLMKMLTIPALQAWKNDKRAEIIRKNIPFYGVYISTDIYWDVKNQTYSKQLEKIPKLSERISSFSVNSNVFKALCNTFLNVINTEIKDNDESKEHQLCLELIKAWKLKPTIPRLVYIKESIDERIDEVNQLIQDLIFNFSKDQKLTLPSYFNLAFESSIERIIPIFERIYKIQDNSKKWALCFDELEFAPLWLQEKLFTSLRSRKQYILYKLSSSPILTEDLLHTFKSDFGPTSGNDVELIKMWDFKDSEEFSDRIIKTYLGLENDPIDVFGSNPVYSKLANSYETGSDFHDKIIGLAEKDDSFKKFLQNKKVDVNNISFTNSKEKNELYRKIKPIVYHREFFIEKNSFVNGVKYRSRKKYYELYSGIEVITKICDGNPRWLITIINQMRLKLKDGKIAKSDQFDELFKASKRFLNVMANIPVGKSVVTLSKLIERVGESFKNQILGKNFLMDPCGTFKVDTEEDLLDEDIVRILYKGVSQGAFILLDYNDDTFDFELRGKRFKLSYLFFILYNLPLRNYTAMYLSDALKDIKDSDNFNQGTLFKTEI
ncbi:MAG: hypothetical protein KDC90_00520 [Ignavibacteriae bacterium]|nr:hypothetical protein [Ignavibacteriota bacterium]